MNEPQKQMSVHKLKTRVFNLGHTFRIFYSCDIWCQSIVNLGTCVDIQRLHHSKLTGCHDFFSRNDRQKTWFGCPHVVRSHGKLRHQPTTCSGWPDLTVGPFWLKEFSWPVRAGVMPASATNLASHAVAGN